MDKEMILWAIVLIAAVLLEVGTMQLISIWFAVGALAAFIASFFLPFGYQLVIFIIATAIMLIVTRPLIRKIRPLAVPTNHDRDIGETAVVIEEINSAQNTGRVKLKGVDWSALSIDGSVISEGETVIIRKISGAHLEVEKKNTIDTSKSESAEVH
ncbi:MAG: NfeD family protein [Ruminococcus sp.]|nr:NfeD family protein [Ruminococcus sp.]